MGLLTFGGAEIAATASATQQFFGTDGADVFTGTAAAEAFWGGGGDVMAGGGGDDTYYLKSATDRVVELAGGGVDKIVAWTSVNLADYLQVENVTVGGDKTYGAGNGLDNIVEGQAGSQQLYGGGGQDVLIGGAGADTFIVVKGEGNDAIQDFEFGVDQVRLKAGFSTFDQVKSHLSQAGADVKLDLGGDDALIFRNATVAQFTAHDFQLELNRATLGVQTFSDEFSAPLSLWDKESNPTGVWRPDLGYQGEQGVGSYTLVSNDEKQIYTSPYFRGHAGDFAETPFTANADGTLSIWARPSTNGELFGYGYTSGMITTKESFAQTYGYFEMRADLPDAAGAWPAFWLIPADGSWPPELDVMETLTSDPNGLWTTEHSGVGGAHTANGLLSFVPDTTDGFHTYGALWGPSEIVWYVDNVEIFRSATPADMNKPMFMLANLAMGGWGGTIDTSALPAEMKIDYIRAYALPGAQTPVPAEVLPVPVAKPATTTYTGGGFAAGDDGVTVMGGDAADTIDGGAGRDYLRGGDGDDLMHGGAGFDDMHGNMGNDVLFGGDGEDWVVGGKGHDQLFGEAGHDIVLGNMGDDTLDGGSGDDIVRGGQGNDVLVGGDGNDWMSGDLGDDTISGGAGADVFHSFGEAGLDRILDFNAAEGDRLQLDAGVTWTVSQSGADTVVDLSGGAHVVLVGVQMSSLPEGWLFT